MRDKKGDVAINWIIVAALALLALFILAFIFKSQVSSFVGQYQNTGDKITAAQEGTSCDDFFSGRKCFRGKDSCSTAENDWQRVSPPPGNEWKDCPATGNAAGICCERIET